MIVIESFFDVYKALFFLMLVFVIGILVGKYIKRRKTDKENLITADYLYDYALIAYNQKDFLLALYNASMAAASIKGSHAAYNLVGMIFNNYERFDLAARAFDEACWEIQKLVKAEEPEWETYYRYNAAFAYFKIENFEFAIDRANKGMWSISNNAQLRYKDEIDLESKLRIIRLMSLTKLIIKKIKWDKKNRDILIQLRNQKVIVVKNLSIYDAHQIAKKDAHWIIHHSLEEIGVEFAETFLKIDQVSEEYFHEIFNKFNN